jgi:hypothetical protein
MSEDYILFIRGELHNFKLTIKDCSSVENIPDSLLTMIKEAADGLRSAIVLPSSYNLEVL